MSVESLGDRSGDRFGRSSAKVRQVLVVTALALASVSASGCLSGWRGWRSGPSLPSPNLTAAQWHLATLNHLPAVPGDAADRPWLRFNDKAKTFAGSAGCNSISGPYTHKGTTLHFGRTISTARACTDAALNQQEQAFKFALQNVDRYDIRGDTLILSVGADAVAYLGK